MPGEVVVDGNPPLWECQFEHIRDNLRLPRVYLTRKKTRCTEVEWEECDQSPIHSGTVAIAAKKRDVRLVEADIRIAIIILHVWRITDDHADRCDTHAQIGLNQVECVGYVVAITID